MSTPAKDSTSSSPPTVVQLILDHLAKDAAGAFMLRPEGVRRLREHLRGLAEEGVLRADLVELTKLAYLLESKHRSPQAASAVLDVGEAAAKSLRRASRTRNAPQQRR